jgi:hypothetical protein
MPHIKIVAHLEPAGAVGSGNFMSSEILLSDKTKNSK